jgi:hypothetical protein
MSTISADPARTAWSGLDLLRAIFAALQRATAIELLARIV